MKCPLTLATLLCSILLSGNALALNIPPLEEFGYFNGGNSTFYFADTREMVTHENVYRFVVDVQNDPDAYEDWTGSLYVCVIGDFGHANYTFSQVLNTVNFDWRAISWQSKWLESALDLLDPNTKKVLKTYYWGHGECSWSEECHGKIKLDEIDGKIYSSCSN